MPIIQQVSQLTKISQKQVAAVIDLLQQDNTVPFIARYRKEMTGSLDEIQIKHIEESYQYITQLNKRKEEVIRLIDEQGQLTEELSQQIMLQTQLQRVEDLYRPFKKKKRTRATIAKEKGLQPLADYLLTLPQNKKQLADMVTKYINDEVENEEVALQGAQDIIAEKIADEAVYRKYILQGTLSQGWLVTTLKKQGEEKDEQATYQMYYDYQERLAKILPHRVLAINRGEKSEILKVDLQIEAEKFYVYLAKQIITQPTVADTLLNQVIKDAYHRLIAPSIEREIRSELTKIAEEQAIVVFGENLRNLLLQAPLKEKMILGVDPAYRTGCKLALIDQQGNFVMKDVIYPHPPAPKAKQAQAQQIINKILNDYPIDLIAIGNGTASRETEQFIAQCLQIVNKKIDFVIVNEAGASVYSASDIAREEFPDFQVEERSAVSIARRLQDPLSELVKIDPKSIGVGQYQHDVSQKRLTEVLDFTVETAVNQVGVNINTASAQLLQYVSGVSKTIANNIVDFRQKNGNFRNSQSINKVPRLGKKTYEQAIGFLRIFEGDNILDATAIHPESYSATVALLKSQNLTVNDIGTEKLKQQLKSIDLNQLAQELSIGVPTLTDIKDSLIAPMRDIRDNFPTPLLKSDVVTLKDLKPGMQLEGTVRNVVDFGAFVDIGLKNDGLVHISKISKKFIKHPMEVVTVGAIVTVWVHEINDKTGKVALTMLDPHQ